MVLDGDGGSPAIRHNRVYRVAKSPALNHERPPQRAPPTAVLFVRRSPSLLCFPTMFSETLADWAGVPTNADASSSDAASTPTLLSDVASETDVGSPLGDTVKSASTSPPRLLGMKENKKRTYVDAELAEPAPPKRSKIEEKKAVC